MPRKNISIVLILLAIFGLGFFAFSTEAQAAIIFQDNFDADAIDANKWAYDVDGSDWSIGPVNSPARAGNNSAKFYIRRVDNASYRAELTPKALSLFRINNDYWFGFSLYLPVDWVNDIQGETVFQVASNPDFSLGEIWRSPTLQLMFDESANKWSWRNNWDPKELTIGNDPLPEGGRDSLWAGDLSKGQWIDWVVHYKPHYLNTGIVEIWKDDQRIVNKTGPNTYNDKGGLFVKTGIYKSKWKNGPTNVNARTLYIDEFRVGDGSSNYEEVKPEPKTYYAAPPNHNPIPVASGNCTVTNPCTPAYAINTKAGAGDTVSLKDGIYTGTDYMIVFPYDDWNQGAQKCDRVVQGGEPGMPVTIKAENDGKAIIDGEGARKPVVIPCRRYINIEGIRAQNSGGSVISMTGSENINLKRVSGYNAKFGYNINEVIFSISTDSKNILIEDCAAAGTGRKMITPIRDSNVTVRRCFTKWKDYSGPVGSPSSSIDPYGTSDSLFENNIMTMFPHNLNVEGFMIWTHDYSNPSSGNRIFGNVAYNLTSYGFGESSATHRTDNTLFSNNVNIDSENGFLQKGGANTQVDHLNIIGSDSLSYSTDVHHGYCQDCDFEIHGDIRNSIFYNNLKGISNSQKTITKMSVSNDLDGDHYPELNVAGECSSACGTSRTSLTSDYNNLYGIQEYNYYPVSLEGNNDKSIEPNFKVSEYGNGAYLMRPENLKGFGENGGDIGAEVLYRYENGNLTNERLWPWPMENRIQDETSEVFGRCYSVTYESVPKHNNPAINCTGGLWKTLEGVYGNPADVNSDDHVNIKDIQICIKAIVAPGSFTTPDQLNQLVKCQAVAPPDYIVNIKDIQAIIRKIINP